MSREAAAAFVRTPAGFILTGRGIYQPHFYLPQTPQIIVEGHDLAEMVHNRYGRLPKIELGLVCITMEQIRPQ